MYWRKGRFTWQIGQRGLAAGKAQAAHCGSLGASLSSGAEGSAGGGGAEHSSRHCEARAKLDEYWKAIVVFKRSVEC